MSDKMNEKECANCVVHGWTQPDSETSLLTCKNCESIEYCSNECQDEHWAKVHKNHCKYFADPAKNEAWQHKETDCAICIKAGEVGEANLKEADNPNYECIFKVEIPQSLIHPHPFPVTGQESDIYEKGIIILWQLVRKFKIIHPDIAHNCQQEFLELENAFIEKRVEIWVDRKIYPHPEAQRMDTERIRQNLTVLSDKMNLMKSMTPLEDPFELWTIVIYVSEIVYNMELINKSKFLKDPLVDLPEDIKKLLSEGMDVDKTNKYLTLAGKALEALSTQVILWENVLKIIGEDSLEKECSYCSEEVDISSRDAYVIFSLLHSGKFSCGSQECQEKNYAAWDDQSRFNAALEIMWDEREANTCDFCFQRTPVKQQGSEIHDIHRCSHCKTTMYCSRDCQVRDYYQVHEKGCKKDKEGRKKKMGGSDRRKAGREQIERMETENAHPIFLVVLEKFKLKHDITKQE